MNRRVIISGGGTGGHIFPALSIANALKKLDPNIEILFVGAEGKMEMDRVPKSGYKIIGLPISGFNRSSKLKNIGLPLKIIKSLYKAKKIIREFSPNIVIGVGGYASGPMLWSAKKSSIPYFIQEQNSYAGVTNRILGKGAAKIFVAYEQMERFFDKDKIEISGNPVREGIRKRDCELRDIAHKHFSIDSNKKTVLIIGGSLGARTLNECVEQFALQNIDCEYNIIWQCGRFYYNRAIEFTSKISREYLKLFQFIEEMDMAYAAADLVISRAGAGTISELAVASKATIFVPSPNVAEDHQTHNAKALTYKNAAILINDSQAKERLFNVIKSVISDNITLAKMEENIASFAKKDAANHIAVNIIEQIENGNK